MSSKAERFVVWKCVGCGKSVAMVTEHTGKDGKPWAAAPAAWVVKLGSKVPSGACSAECARDR